jgi:hypothetical protein
MKKKRRQMMAKVKQWGRIQMRKAAKEKQKKILEQQRTAMLQGTK